eukprot:TRINITY_DN18767_c1_g1_i1.p1 TRINITY_DN18767_c1_g1~~TRINITY_DN18767_c1_g1_i1.p1  ORF type:complete len:1308 (-),score=307.48 TRINITY_DN18767_c1_g1_i1:57-3980(-)
MVDSTWQSDGGPQMQAAVPSSIASLGLPATAVNLKPSGQCAGDASSPASLGLGGTPGRDVRAASTRLASVASLSLPPSSGKVLTTVRDLRESRAKCDSSDEEDDVALLAGIEEPSAFGRSHAENLGKVQAIGTLMTQFAYNEKLIGQFEELAFSFPAWRPVRGDGNCYYRAVLFAWLERSIALGAQHSVESFSQLLKAHKEDPQLSGKVKLCRQLLKDWVRKRARCTSEAKVRQLLLSIAAAFDNVSVDRSFIACLRHLIAEFLVQHAHEPFALVPEGEVGESLTYEKWATAASDARDIADYCTNYVNVMDKDAEDLIQHVCPRILATVVRICMVDRDTVRCNFIDYGEGECEAAVPPPTHRASSVKSAAQLATTAGFGGVQPEIFILLKPGHYDILVPRGERVAQLLAADFETPLSGAEPPSPAGLGETAASVRHRAELRWRSLVRLGYEVLVTSHGAMQCMEDKLLQELGDKKTRFQGRLDEALFEGTLISVLDPFHDAMQRFNCVAEDSPFNEDKDLPPVDTMHGVSSLDKLLPRLAGLLGPDRPARAAQQAVNRPAPSAVLVAASPQPVAAAPSRPAAAPPAAAPVAAAPAVPGSMGKPSVPGASVVLEAAPHSGLKAPPSMGFLLPQRGTTGVNHATATAGPAASMARLSAASSPAGAAEWEHRPAVPPGGHAKLASAPAASLSEVPQDAMAAGRMPPAAGASPKAAAAAQAMSVQAASASPAAAAVPSVAAAAAVSSVRTPKVGCCICMQPGATAEAKCGCAYHVHCLQAYAAENEDLSCHIHERPFDELFQRQHLPGRATRAAAPLQTRATRPSGAVAGAPSSPAGLAYSPLNPFNEAAGGAVGSSAKPAPVANSGVTGSSLSRNASAYSSLGGGKAAAVSRHAAESESSGADRPAPVTGSSKSVSHQSAAAGGVGAAQGVPCVLCFGEDGFLKTLHCGYKCHVACLRQFWSEQVVMLGRLSDVRCPAEVGGCQAVLLEADLRGVVGSDEMRAARKKIQDLEAKTRSLIEELKQESEEYRPMFKCAICLVEHEVEGCCTLPCQHRFCFESLQYHFDIIVRERRLSKLTCPAEGCGYNLRSEESIHIFGQCLSNSTYNKLLEFLARDDSHVVECRHLGCEERVYLDDGDDASNLVCRQHHRFCAKCDHGPHPGISCEERLERLERDKKEAEVMKEHDEAWKNALSMGWKPCPQRCSFGGGFKADSECDHVTCECGFEFCWGCGVDRRVLLAHDNRWHRPSCQYHTNPSEVSEPPVLNGNCPDCRRSTSGRCCAFPQDDGYPESYIGRRSVALQRQQRPVLT